MNQVATKTTTAVSAKTGGGGGQVIPMEDQKPLKLHEDIEARTSQFEAALPPHIPVERFKRVLLTAVQSNPDLVNADRRTLFTSAVKAAQDGLLPDGREGALVIYNTKVKEGDQEQWVKAVQWMPMIQGIRKKVRNSGEIATWDVKVVYEKDAFIYEEGFETILQHKPFLDGHPGQLKHVYSVAKLKSGEITIDVMPRWQVDRIRALSKSKDRGPWVDHYDEMAKKTVARRHSKVLPMSTDLDDLMRRDDALYDFEGKSDKALPERARRPQLADFTTKTAELAGGVVEEKGTDGAVETVNQETGEVTDYGAADAFSEGAQAATDGKTLTDIPRSMKALGLAEAWEEGWRSEQPE